jgi:hypothetical protein
MRMRGNSARLTSAFIADVTKVWELRGIAELFRMVDTHPIQFIEMVAKLCRVTKLEFGSAGAFEQPRTREEVLDKMEERSGSKGRALLAAFLEQMDKMEAGEDDGG